MGDVLVAWFGLLFGLTGVGALLNFVVSFLRSSGGFR